MAGHGEKGLQGTTPGNSPGHSRCHAKVCNFEQTRPRRGCLNIRRGASGKVLGCGHSGLQIGIPAELFAGAAALMVLDSGASRGTCHVGLSASRLFAFSRIQPPLVSPSRVTEVCKSQGPKVGTGLRFKLKVLRSGCVVALFAAPHGKEFPSLSPGRDIHESPAGLPGIS